MNYKNKTYWWTDCHATCSIYIYGDSRELLVLLKLETEWSRFCINNRKQPLHQDRWRWRFSCYLQTGTWRVVAAPPPTGSVWGNTPSSPDTSVRDLELWQFTPQICFIQTDSSPHWAARRRRELDTSTEAATVRTLWWRTLSRETATAGTALRHDILNIIV